jgi:hypothetical protein
MQVDAGQQARRAMLRMAQSAREAGLIYHAIHAYEYVLASYPYTEESHQAVKDFIGLAQYLEQQGMFHTATTLYEKLGKLR